MSLSLTALPELQVPGSWGDGSGWAADSRTRATLPPALGREARKGGGGAICLVLAPGSLWFSMKCFPENTPFSEALSNGIHISS